MNPQLVTCLLIKIINQWLLKEKFVRQSFGESKHMATHALLMHVTIRPLGERNTSAWMDTQRNREIPR